MIFYAFLFLFLLIAFAFFFAIEEGRFPRILAWLDGIIERLDNE